MAIAQFNIARLVAERDSPQVAEFMENLDRINSLGKRMPGFIWLLEGNSGPQHGATDLVVSEDDPLMMPNLSVWASVEALHTFVFATLHKRFFDKRHLWFEKNDQPYLVMWPLAADHRPTIAEGMEKLTQLRQEGDSDQAFGWEFAKSRSAELCHSQGR